MTVYIGFQLALFRTKSLNRLDVDHVSMVIHRIAVSVFEINGDSSHSILKSTSFLSIPTLSAFTTSIAHHDFV